MDKILQTTSYIETARLAVQYQFSFSSCKEIIQEHSTLLQLSEFKQTSAIISSNTSSYPLCISFKLSVLTNLDFPHQYIVNTINNFPYKLHHVKEYLDPYGVHYIIIFN